MAKADNCPLLSFMTFPETFYILFLAYLKKQKGVVKMTIFSYFCSVLKKSENPF